MLQFLSQQTILFYTMALICAWGVISQVVLRSMYGNLLRDVRRQGMAKGKFMKQLRQRYQNVCRMKQNVPFVRSFSALEPYQEAYTLACSLETEGQGCWLTVSRTKAPDDPADTARTWVPAPEEECGRLLQFLYENSVQPELWQDAISCWYPQAEQAENLREGGASCEL